MTLVLASGSAARKEMLSAAGLEFKSHPADLDEAEIIKDEKARGASPADIAQSLACKKALHVALEYPGDLVIGADQILECEGRILSKASDVSEAFEKLQSLRGRTHQLISAVAVARGKDILWQYAGKASLHMHDFDDDFLNAYTEKAGEALFHSVGAYELESIGAQLFDHIEGDYFTILGLPLLPLLSYLRDEQGMSL